MQTDSTLAVEFFDGRSARAVPARLRVLGERLRVEAADDPAELLHEAPLASLTWPERMAGGTRILNFSPRGAVHCTDAAAWDAWVAVQVPRSLSWVAAAQQSWRATAGAAALVVAALASAYVWGLPWGSRAVLVLIPLSVDQRLGETALGQVERLLLKPSTLPLAEQQQWQQAFAATVQRAYPADTAPAYKLLFRGSRIGPNAFALPGGTMVLTDELVELSRKAGPLQSDLVLGVLAHELGHVKHRHGMQNLISSSALALVSGALIGDYSSLLAGLPVLLGQAGFSRDAEREADAESRRFMRAAGLSPLGMVKFFELVRAAQAEKEEARCLAAMRKEKVNEQEESGAAGKPLATASAPAPTLQEKLACATAPREQGNGLGIAIASHPADAERIAAFASSP